MVGRSLAAAVPAAPRSRSRGRSRPTRSLLWPAAARPDGGRRAPRPRAARRLASQARPRPRRFPAADRLGPGPSKSRGTPRLIFDPPRAAAFGSSAAAAATAAAAAAAAGAAAAAAAAGAAAAPSRAGALSFLGGARFFGGDSSIAPSSPLSLPMALLPGPVTWARGRASAVGGGRPRWSPLSFSVSRRGVRNQPALAPLCEGFWQTARELPKAGLFGVLLTRRLQLDSKVCEQRASWQVTEAFTKLLVRQQTRSDCHSSQKCGRAPIDISARRAPRLRRQGPALRETRARDSEPFPRRRRARC